MNVLNSKLMSFEEDCVEYENKEEYAEDLDRRRKAGWTRMKRPDFEKGEMIPIIKIADKGKIIQRYKRFGAIKINL